jgi:hypothetical protein
MRKENLPITAMGDLIDALYADRSSQKMKAWVEYYPPGTCKVIQTFDSGKGHSGAFWEEQRPLDIKLFEDAKRLGYVTPWVLPGRMSENEFKLTEDREKRRIAFEIMSTWQVEEHARLQKDYLLKKVPEEHRGFCFMQALDATDASLPSRRLQLALAQAWATRNQDISSLNIPSGLLSVTLPMDRATIIQWLGTDEGVAFLKGAFANAGWRPPEPPKQG